MIISSSPAVVSVFSDLTSLDPVTSYESIHLSQPIYSHFKHILQKEKWYNKSFCYFIAENHLYTKFGKKKNPEH